MRRPVILVRFSDHMRGSNDFGSAPNYQKRPDWFGVDSVRSVYVATSYVSESRRLTQRNSRDVTGNRGPNFGR